MITAFLGVRGTIVAGVLGALLVAASGTAVWQYLRAETADAARQRAYTARDNAKNELIVCTNANESIQFVEAARAKFAAANAEAYRTAAAESRAALIQAEREKAASDALLREWKKTWGDRSAQCTAALQTLDTACPELRRY